MSNKLFTKLMVHPHFDEFGVVVNACNFQEPKTHAWAGLTPECWDMKNEGVLDSPVKPIVTAIMGLAHYSIFSKAISEQDVMKTLQSIGHLDRINSGVTFSVTWLTGLVNDVLSYWKNEGQVFSLEKFPEIRQLADDLDLLMDELKNGADYDYENFDRLIFIESRLRDLSRKCSGKDMLDEKRSLEAITRAIHPLRQKFERLTNLLRLGENPLA